MGERQPFWALGYREAKAHTVIVAVLLWFAVAVMLFAGHGDTSPTGALKGADFVHFYTLGYLARIDPTSLYSGTALYATQVSLIPASADMHYLVNAYPPQMALLFAPFANWSYRVAFVLWTVMTVGTYVVVVAVLRRRSLRRFGDTTFIVAAAAAFPPFALLVLNGQTTAFPLIAFFAAWLALERRRTFVAGLALGVLAMKPNLGLALGVVALASGEWRMIAGALTSAGLQLAAVVSLLGPSVIRDYWPTALQLVTERHLIEPKPYQIHSITALTDLLPEWASTPAWALAAVGILVMATRGWRSSLPVAPRLGMVVIATVLIAPHLTIYDATLLVLPIAWIGGWVLETGAMPPLRYWSAVYLLYVLLLFPLAAVIRIQLSVLVLGWLFVSLHQCMTGDGRHLARATASVG